MTKKSPDPQIVFGHLLRRLRTERGLSQEALAFESGLSREFIAYIEGGKRKPTIVALLQLARGLNMSASAIIAELEKELGRETSPNKPIR